MAHVAGHLSVDELQAGYRGSGDATLARHYQVIWLLAQGRTCAEVAGLTSFAVRWVEQLLERYNAFGPGRRGAVCRFRKTGRDFAPGAQEPEKGGSRLVTSGNRPQGWPRARLAPRRPR